MILPDDQRQSFLSDHPDWALAEETITRIFVFTDFVAAMGFVASVAIVAERADHHPDIDIRWNKVTIALTTHDAGGLTGQDTALAIEIEKYA